MRAFNYCKLIVTCCFVALMSSCAEEDEYRAYTVSGRWFGDLGMMVDGQPALGSDIEFIQEGYRATWGHGYETDYYRSYRGVVSVEHYFEWSIDYGIIYLRFDDPALDCNIRDYSLSPDYFEGYLDGVYSSVCFSLRNYDLYWNSFGYYSGEYYSYRRAIPSDTAVSVPLRTGDEPVCVRRLNVEP